MAWWAMPPTKFAWSTNRRRRRLGYAITEPGALVLVFDFGGGTLDLSLVQLPENREHTGGFLSMFRRTPSSRHAARVMAKAGRVIGGSDVDHWLLAEVLRQTRLTIDQLGHDYAALLTHCEQAKIDLSTQARPPPSCLKPLAARIPSFSRAPNSSRCWKPTASTPPFATPSTK